MNAHRFLTLPTSLKPIILILIILAMILAGSSNHKPSESFGGTWFFWLTFIVQIIFMLVVNAFFALEIERLMTCGRDSWPIAECVYSGVFGIVNIINTFIVASWNSIATNSGVPVAAAMTCFALVILYGLGGFMMFRLWRGFVASGASQNPTATTQPGNIQGMHPGI